MAGTLAAGMMGMNVSAASVHSGNPITTIPVTKNVLTDGNTMAPNTTFEFEVAVADAGTFNDGNKDQVVYEGIAGGLTAETGAAFTPGGKGSAAETYTAEGSLKTDAAVFKRPGVYHYTVTEKANNYEGVTTDTTSYDVYVYVYNRTDGLYVGNVVSAKNGGKADLIFNNDYGQDENKDTTHDVVIKKVITGEKYKVTLDNAEQNPLTSGEKATYTVTNNTEIHIYGLTEGDKVQAVEEANTQGYQATYTTGLSEGTLTISRDGSEATVTNTKNSTSPTGIILNYGPYILMIALAGSMVVFFFFKRNRKEA